MHPDLFFALRGGGSNFGVVTRFDVNAYPVESLWGGMKSSFIADLAERKSRLGIQESFNWTVHSALNTLVRWIQTVVAWVGYAAQSRDFIDSMLEIARETANDTDDATQVLSYFAWTPQIKGYLVGSTTVTTKPKESLKGVQMLRSVPHIASTLRPATFLNLTKELGDFNPPGYMYVADIGTTAFREAETDQL